jgi:hypothetical protein
VRDVDCRACVGVEPCHFDVADHADDLDVHPFVAARRDAQALAQWVLAVELLFHQCVADDGDARRIGHVRGGEVASRPVRNAHGREESRRDRPHVRDGGLARGGLRAVSTMEAGADSWAGQG